MDMAGQKRLWDFISFSEKWRNADTSVIDDISPSWFERKKVLQANSKEYEDFIERLKREHAIETGIVERMYDLKRGITETLIKEGFIQSLISHGDTNVPTAKLFDHLRDHLDAVDFVFDIVKHDRTLTVSFIKELHALVTRHQKYTTGRDQFGAKTEIELISGDFKTRDNNPSREDGVIIMYCPPEHVASEMDNLVKIYDCLVSDHIHPVIIASWFHHSFTLIHPFQDGNGRMARLLSSLILIQSGFFPFTVLREEAKVKYFEALETADNGEPQKLVDYFGEVQKRYIETALNLRDINTTSLEEATYAFSKKLKIWQHRKLEEKDNYLARNRNRVFDFCDKHFNAAKTTLTHKEKSISVTIRSCPPGSEPEQQYYYGQIVKYAKQHDYFFNHSLPRAWITFRIKLSEEKIYQLGITIHHYGYDDTTIAIGAFLEFSDSKNDNTKDRVDAALPFEIDPHVFSINNDVSPKEKNIRSFLDNALTLMLAQIASEL